MATHTANQEHLEAFKESVHRWREWRSNHRDIKPDLSDISVGERDLSGYDLSGANLKRVDFRGVTFGNCKLTDAELREATLCGADLRNIAGSLQAQKLAGADLTGTTLPKSLEESFADLEVAKGISKNAQKLFVVMLAACVYSWLAIAATTDANLITNSASSPLPIIQTSIPIVGFYFVTPLLLLGVYFYFHFYMQKLWDEMGSLPAIFQDGRPLTDKADPWLLSDLVRAHVSKLRRDRPFLSYLQEWISILLAWWMVPITLACFWGRYLVRHDMSRTELHCVLMAISVTGAIILHRLARATLCGDVRWPFVWKLALRQAYAWRALAIAVASAAALIAVSIGAMHGVRLGKPGRDWWPRPRDPRISSVVGRYAGSWIPAIMETLIHSPFANLRAADLSSRRESPSGKGESTPEPMQGVNLSGMDLRFADMRGTNLRRTVLTDADLEWADLLAADLTEGELAGAHMENTNLLAAHLERADLTGVNLSGADLTLANLSGAELKYADLTGAGGLTDGMLKQGHDWCNASYDLDSPVTGLPNGNNDRIKRWRRHEGTAFRNSAGADEATRVAQLLRWSPGMNVEVNRILGHLYDTYDESSPAPGREETRKLARIPWPSGTAPVAVPMDSTPVADSALPASDFLVITWTMDEAQALAAVFTQGYDIRAWYSYSHLFDPKFKARIAKDAPASQLHLLGRYFPCRVGSKSVLLFKSDLHFTTDGARLPLADLLEQVTGETRARLVITTGTAGPIGRGLLVGDVVVASTSTFRCNRQFKDADFNGRTFASAAQVPAEQLEFANQYLLQANASQLAGARERMPLVPQIYWDDTPQPDVVVTMDSFATDDIQNTYNLQCLGSVIEMDDAVLGLACNNMGDRAPKWLSVRNISIPQLSRDSVEQERSAAAAIYRHYGFWTSLQSAIATWAIIAGSP